MVDITLDSINEKVEKVILKENPEGRTLVIKFKEKLSPLLREIILKTFFRVHWIDKEGRYREDRPPYLESVDKRVEYYLINNNGCENEIKINISWMGEEKRPVKLELLCELKDKKGVQKSFIYEIMEVIN